MFKATRQENAALHSAHPLFYRSLALLLLCAAVHAPANADVVVMRNGDRLTGKVVHKKADELLFATSYAGTLKLKWSDVASVATDKPVALVIGDAHMISGTLAGRFIPGSAEFAPTGPRGARYCAEAPRGPVGANSALPGMNLPASVPLTMCASPIINSTGLSVASDATSDHLSFSVLA